MKCQDCGFENAYNAKFCNECGTSLETPCPNCKTQNPFGSKYCLDCGQALTTSDSIKLLNLSFDEKISRIQKYLPPGLTEKILSQREKIEGEKKYITVMFCDMEGYTSLAERLGPEGTYTLMDQVYEILIHKVSEYGGTVNELIGDGVLALFGAPIALEDSPQRAIRSAYGIHKEMVKFSEKMSREIKEISQLKMRIGIHNGPIVVGTLGNDLRIRFKAVGDTVNLAFRIGDLAEPGTTYVTENIFKLTEGFFRFEALGEKYIKGKGAPIKAFRVIAPSQRKTRFDVSAERGLTPFVGRDKELELMLDGFMRAKQGRGQAFSIISEAGAGKSRLLYEFRKAVLNEDITFLEGKCLSYSRGEAYHPVIDILKSNFDIKEDDGELEIREKVTKGLEALQVVEKNIFPYLLDILSVENSGLESMSMSNEARKDNLSQAILQIVQKGSEIRPLIMAVEDLHWMDKSSEEVFNYLLDNISGFRVLLIFTLRYEFRPSFRSRSYHQQINLNPLSAKECLQIIYYLLGTEEVDVFLEELILEKSEGIPFFVEEFVKSLKELKIIKKKNHRFQLMEKTTDVPSSIQEIIMARIDALPPEAKEVLQTGSVIEREFSFQLIYRVSGLTEQKLLSCLEILKNSELIYQRGIFPDLTYIFEHALTREIAYDSILTEKKKKIHDEIGKAIEIVYRENLEDYYPLLASHFMKSENYEKGEGYSKLAARNAERSSFFNEAIAHTERRVKCLENLPRSPENQRRIINARTALGFYFFRMNYFVEAKEAIDQIYDLTLKEQYVRKLPLIYTIDGTYYFNIEENFPKAIELLEKAVGLSEKIEDVVFLFFSNLFLGVVLSWDCSFEKSSQYIQKALDLVPLFNQPWNISTLKSNLSYYSYNYQGKISLGYKTSQEALEMSEQSGDIFSKAQAYTTHGISTFNKGFFEEAEKYLMKGLALSERIKLHSYCAVACHYLGFTCFEMGRLKPAWENYQKAIRFRKLTKVVPSGLNILLVASAKAEVFEGGHDIDLNLLYRCLKENKVKIYDGTMARFIGEIKLKMGGNHKNDAEDWIKKAIELHTGYGMKWHLACDYATYADFCIQGGDEGQGEENLIRALELFESCGSEGWVKHIKNKFSRR